MTLLASTSPPASLSGSEFELVGWFKAIDHTGSSSPVLTITLSSSHVAKLYYRSSGGGGWVWEVDDGTDTYSDSYGHGYTGWRLVSFYWGATSIRSTTNASGSSEEATTVGLGSGLDFVSIEYDSAAVAIDELGVWDGRLTYSADFTTLYASGAGRTITGHSIYDDCIAYWKLDEATGATRADSVGSWDLADTAGHVSAYSGKISNGALADGGVFKDCIAYWKCDEATGKFLDSVGGFSLSSNTPADLGRRAGKIGTYAFEKNISASGNVAYGWDTKPANFTTEVLSLAGWIRIGTLPTSGTHNEVMYLETTNGVSAYRTITLYLNATTGRLHIETLNNNTDDTELLIASTFGAISAATWYHVAIVWDNENVDLAINATTDSDGGQESFAGCLEINGISFGRNAGVSDAYAFDEWGIWDRALSSAEITALYNSGDGLSHADSPAGSGAAAAYFGFH